MAYKIYAEKKMYPRDEGYKEDCDYADTHLTDSDKRIMMKRIRQDNRWWVVKQVIEGIMLFFILHFVIVKLFR